jgi:hypothetical protein
MKLLYIALAAVAAALVSVPAHAQPEVVARQVSDTDSIMRERGFLPDDDVVMGTLAAGADEEFELVLDNGADYMVVGVCDNACSDVDLVLTDQGGTEVESDRMTDDKPVLARIGEAGGTFVLAVEMASCGSSTCHYGVRVYRKR